MTNQRPLIWITGASSGLGLQLVLDYLDRGYRVIASSRNIESNQRLLKEAHCFLLAVDISSKESLAHAQDVILDQFGFLDKLIVNAGTCEYATSLPYDLSMWERIYQTNLWGAIATINTALPLLKKSRQKPQIVGIGSMAFFAPFSKAAFYGASKAGLDYFLKALQVDLYPHNIDVSIIHPGFIKTPLTDKNTFSMPFILSVEKASALVVDAIESRKKYFYFPKRLRYILRLSQLFPSLWIEKVAEKLPFRNN